MVLTVESLSYVASRKPLIEKINLTFTDGILHGILGPNGSGKSTLFKTMAGIWKPTQGNVFWKGENLLQKNRQEISRTISLVPQNLHIHFDFTVKEIVAMGRYSHQKRNWTTEEENLLERSLVTVDAWHLRNREVNRLSNGERQRVYIARALISESPILLLDEPTSCLDIRHQIDIWHLLKEMAKNGKIVIAATHDLHLAERFCDQVVVLNQGKCIGSGSFPELINAKLLETVFSVVKTPDLPQASFYDSFVAK